MASILVLMPVRNMNLVFSAEERNEQLFPYIFRNESVFFRSVHHDFTLN